MRNKTLCFWSCMMSIAGCLEVPDRGTETIGSPIDAVDSDAGGDASAGGSGGDASSASGGIDPFERMTAAGYTFSSAAENIAVGQSSPQEVVDGWLASDGHCANMMNKSFTQIGVGYDFGPYDSGIGQSFDAAYWTQNFGRPR